MRDEDDGMNDMNESYQRYMMTTLDSSRSGFCEEEDSVVGSVTDIGIERKNSKRYSLQSSVYQFKRHNVLEAKKKSEDIDKRLTNKNLTAISLSVLFVLLSISSIILVTLFYYPPVSNLMNGSILFQKNKFDRFNERSTSDQEINAFLDLPGSDHLLDILHINRNCFHQAKHALHNRRNTNNSSRIKEFIVASNICDLIEDSTRGSSILKPNVILSLFVENPFIRAITSFYDKQDPNNVHFSEDLIGLYVEEYLESSLLDNNVLTRSLLCKPNDHPLNNNDLTAAKSILDQVNTISVFDHYESIMKIQPEFIKVINKKCVKSDNIKKRTSRGLEEYHGLLQIVDKYLENLKKANEYDMHLYSYVLNNLV